MTTQDTLLTELERQAKYLSRLPDDYAFPLFNARVALESMRKSAYKDTASAAREIIDNSIEAGAERIHVVFEEEMAESGRVVVTAIAFIDDGPGMLPLLTRFALSWGGGTHFDDPKFIGKFGFGLPNSSINQTKYTSVYTRTGSAQPITVCSLNLDEYAQWGTQSVPPPSEGELPEFVRRYMNEHDLAFDHGVVVVWDRPDRLTAKRGATLAEQLLEDFGIAYRYLLLSPDHPLRITVRGREVEPVDPLFLEPDARYYLQPIADLEAHSGGGARLTGEFFIPVRYWEDRATGEQRLDKVSDLDQIDLDDPTTLSLGTVHVRIARLPLDFAPDRGGDDTQKRRFRIRKSRRGMSFVRAGREIETVDIFPKDRSAQGLGDWPLLQSFAYNWGIEIRFGPQLDDVFGITNDKQGVRPIEDFWRVLTAEGIDAAARQENNWQTKARIKRKDEINAAAAGEDREGPTPAEAAATEADVATSERPAPPEHAREGARDAVEEEVHKRAEVTGEQREQVREALLREAAQNRYRIEFADQPDGPFYEPSWFGTAMIVRVNTAHPFFTTVYQRLDELNGGFEAKQGIDTLLLALGRAELTVADEQMSDWYRAQRRSRWSPFLEDALKILSRKLTSAAGGPAEEEVAAQLVGDPT